MKRIVKSIPVVMITIIIVVIIIVSLNNIFAVTSKAQNHDAVWIDEWQYQWDDSGQINITNINQLDALHMWTWTDSRASISNRVNSNDTLWIRFKVPDLEKSPTALFMNKLYANTIRIYIDGELAYTEDRDYMYDMNTILLPLQNSTADKDIVMNLSAHHNRLGMAKEVIIGDYQSLSKKFFTKDITDVVLGSTIIFIGLIMFICTFFFRTTQLAHWVSLNAVLLSIGTIMMTYSPYLYTHFGDYGELYIILFDVALFIFLPGLVYIFESMLDVGFGGSIRILRKFQVLYSIFCCSLLLINLLLDNKIFSVYYFCTVTILGVIIIIEAILLIAHAVVYAFRGDKDAIIISIGFAMFALLVIIEMVWFYLQETNYELVLWKWGLLLFLTSLIVVLGRKLATNHRQVIEYAMELERFNNELQRSEKMDIISELAASVAHEVRNPLQVTRGFIQLLEEKSQDKEKEYLRLALDELDRASNIITDFLTFAKPGNDHDSLIDIWVEFKHIEGILLPLANYQGGRVHIGIPAGLTIRGNNSKFKQAFINMIKNSIEALDTDGIIKIWAYREREQVVIHIYDNGEGMESDEIKRLGEPYFSNKSRGTGLGLMVTFRIIEAMNGTIEFISQKGVGTEVVIRFPVAVDDAASEK
ncbi:ATP-binding protein [Paenibacillus sp. CMAA1364]